MGKGSSSKKAAAAAQQTANTQADNILATNASSNQALQNSANFANQAMNPLGRLLGLNGYDAQAGADAVTNDAGYKYGLDQAIKAQDTSAAARGSLMSGASLLDTADLGNRYYTDARNNAISNYMNLYNTGNGLISNIANNNNAAAGNAASIKTNAANNYAQQRIAQQQANQQLLMNGGATALAAFGF